MCSSRATYKIKDVSTNPLKILSYKTFTNASAERLNICAWHASMSTSFFHFPSIFSHPSFLRRRRNEYSSLATANNKRQNILFGPDTKTVSGMGEIRYTRYPYAHTHKKKKATNSLFGKVRTRPVARTLLKFQHLKFCSYTILI